MHVGLHCVCMLGDTACQTRGCSHKRWYLILHMLLHGMCRYACRVKEHHTTKRGGEGACRPHRVVSHAQARSHRTRTAPAPHPQLGRHIISDQGMQPHDVVSDIACGVAWHVQICTSNHAAFWTRGEEKEGACRPHSVASHMQVGLHCICKMIFTPNIKQGLIFANVHFICMPRDMSICTGYTRRASFSQRRIYAARQGLSICTGSTRRAPPPRISRLIYQHRRRPFQLRMQGEPSRPRPIPQNSNVTCNAKWSNICMRPIIACMSAGSSCDNAQAAGAFCMYIQARYAFLLSRSAISLEAPDVPEMRRCTSLVI